MTDYRARNQKNLRTLGMLFGLVFVMIAVAFASVPLYDLFCRVTGYGGTTGTADMLPTTVIDRTIKVRFYAQTAQNMPWTFEAEQTSVDVKIGQGGLTSYYAKNPTDDTVVGTALYNVTPLKVGKYFKKIQCFCFDAQVLPATKDMHMPVYFYVDPAFHDDPMMDDVDTINLSYTFFEAESDLLDDALEAYYSQQDLPQKAL